MADNVAITAGAGTSVATDDIGGVHYQRVKPQLGADGSAADWPGDGTNGGKVQIADGADAAQGAVADAIVAAGAAGSLSAKLRRVTQGLEDLKSLIVLGVGANTIGNVGLVPRTSGGLSAYSFLSTAAVLAASIKGSAGQVYALTFYNLNAAARYVRLYNQATSPGTGDAANILWRGLIPGNTAGAGFTVLFPQGLAFSTGIGIRVTAAVADNDNTALAANEIIGNVGYA